MRWTFLSAALITAAGAHAAQTDLSCLITCERALEFAGETTRSGSVTVGIAPAPDESEGRHSLKLKFRLHAHNQLDWVDAAFRPSPPIDLSAARALRVWVRAEQETPFLVLKLVDPDNPGANHSLYESALSHGGRPLPAGRWVPVDVPLPEKRDRRDGLTYVGVYVPASDKRIPLNRDLVVYLGRFAYTPPQRPPWPPARTSTPADPSTRRTALAAPLTREGPWALVKGRDNQTDHCAEFRNGSVEFRADAAGWNEYLWSDPARLKLKPLTTYRLQFDYAVLAPPTGATGAMFYSLVRARGTIQEDVGWQRWRGPAGTRGRRIITFTTRDMPDYYLNFGIRHHGAIRLEGVRLWEIDQQADE